MKTSSGGRWQKPTGKYKHWLLVRRLKSCGGCGGEEIALFTALSSGEFTDGYLYSEVRGTGNMQVNWKSSYMVKCMITENQQGPDWNN